MKYALLSLLLFSTQIFGTGERSICGKDDMEDMVSLHDDMKQMGTPVGILRFENSGCTGTLISKDLFLTAGHCYIDCKKMFVTFGFLKARQEKYACKEVVEYNNTSGMNWDYMIIKLEGAPGDQWGWYEMSAKEAKPGDNLLMVHHPLKQPMKVSRTNCTVKSLNGGMLYHSCDTEGGSSGAGILVPDYEVPSKTRLVAVHAYSGCNEASTNYNSGATIKNLMKMSPTLKAMVKD